MKNKILPILALFSFSSSVLFGTDAEIEQFLNTGHDALKHRDILKAEDAFTIAAKQAKEESSKWLQESSFFAAITKLLKFAQTDLSPYAGYLGFKNFPMDLYGIKDFFSRPDPLAASTSAAAVTESPSLMQNNTGTGRPQINPQFDSTSINAFLFQDDKIRKSLLTILTDVENLLAEVSPSISEAEIESFSIKLFTSEFPIENDIKVDFIDALILRSMVNNVISFLHVLHYHNTNFATDQLNELLAGTVDFGEFLFTQQQFLRLAMVNPVDAQKSKEALIKSNVCFSVAASEISTEPENTQENTRKNNLFKLSPKQELAYSYGDVRYVYSTGVDQNHRFSSRMSNILTQIAHNLETGNPVVINPSSYQKNDIETFKDVANYQTVGGIYPIDFNPFINECTRINFNPIFDGAVSFEQVLSLAGNSWSMIPAYLGYAKITKDFTFHNIFPDMNLKKIKHLEKFSNPSAPVFIKIEGSPDGTTFSTSRDIGKKFGTNNSGLRLYPDGRSEVIWPSYYMY